MSVIDFAWDRLKQHPTPQHGFLQAQHRSWGWQVLHIPWNQTQNTYPRAPGSKQAGCGAKPLPPWPPQPSSAAMHPPAFLIILSFTKQNIY